MGQSRSWDLGHVLRATETFWSVVSQASICTKTPVTKKEGERMGLCSTHRGDGLRTIILVSRNLTSFSELFHSRFDLLEIYV